MAPPQRVPPVIFLDVDGVLHPTYGPTFFDAVAMSCLRAIIECTGAVIVLSSAWQVTPSGRAEVDAALARWGIPACVARTTTGTQVGSGEEKRAREIVAWVRSHGPAVASGWIAIDDLDLDSVCPPPSWAPVMPPNHFVKCNDAVGLTRAEAQRAVQLLGGKNPNAPKLPPPAQDHLTPIPRSPHEDKGRGHEVWKTDARYGGQA